MISDQLTLLHHTPTIKLSENFQLVKFSIKMAKKDAFVQ